jgi:carbohydrate-selective porin OprB
VHYQYDHDLSAIPSAAPGAPGWFGRYTWTLSATMDFRKLMGRNQASGTVSLQQHEPEFGQVDAGVDQAYSNLDCDHHTTMDEAWIQQRALGGKLTLKAGRIDANADFDTVPVASGFLNSSMGYSPTLMEFPSYPAPQPGVEVSAMLGRATRMAGGEFRTPGGRMTLVEGDQTWGGGSGPGGDGRSGRLATGMWRLTKAMTRTDGTAGGTGGIYGVLQQSLWKGPLAGGRARTLSGFLQAGSGDKQVNPYSGHLGGGLVWSGLWQATGG